PHQRSGKGVRRCGGFFSAHQDRIADTFETTDALSLEHVSSTTIWFILSLKFYRAARSLLHRCPGLVWIKFGHRLRDGCGLWSEIFLINNAVVVDDERHDSRGAVLRWISDDAETTDHFTPHEIIVSTP